VKTLFCLALAALPAFSQDPQGPVPPIAVYAGFRQEPPAAVMDALRREVAAIMDPIAPPFEWRSLANVTGGEVSEELAVVNFTGACDPSDLMPRSLAPGPLGLTHASDGIILPFCEVNCDRIRQFLRTALVALPLNKRETVFGRAVARVLSHELYHIFAKTAHHDGAGIARATFTSRELLIPEFRLEEGARRPLRVMMAGVRPPHTDGKALFRRGCAPCHGAAGEGTGQGPLLRIAGKSLDFIRLASKLYDHRSKMYKTATHIGVAVPAFEDSEISDLLSYLNEVQH
jgi:hypothetical protein